MPDRKSKIYWTARWTIGASAAIAISSFAYWFFRTGQSLDEFITALSWSSIASIIIGGLISFGSRMTHGNSRFRTDVVAERENSIRQSAQANSAVFGLTFSGLVFLFVTVSIEWIAANMG